MKSICRMTVIYMLLCGLALPISDYAMETSVGVKPRMTDIST